MDMLKVMLVDDENLVLEDLEDLIDWRSKGYDLVAKATNGLMALKLYEKFSPDIIITDIRMPAMDGLELSKIILSKYNHTKIILLTSYKDFEYAKLAVEIGVSNYLLKHNLKKDILLLELNKIRNELINETKDKRIIRQSLLKQVLHQNTNEKIDYGTYLDYGQNISLLLIKTNQPYAILEASNKVYDEYNISKLLGEIKFDTSNIEFSEIERIENIEIDHQRMVMLLIWGKNKSEKKMNDSIYAISLYIRSYVKKVSDKTVTVTAASTNNGISQLATIFQKAAFIMHHSIFFGRDQFLAEDQINLNSEHVDYIDYFKQLKDALDSLDEVKVSEKIYKLFQNTYETYLDIYHFNKLTKNLLVIIDEFCERNYLPTLSEKHRDNELEVPDLYIAKDVIEWLVDLYKSTIVSIKDNEMTQYSPILRQAIKYIQNNYNGNLSIENVSSAVGISSVYLSKLFKKESKGTFLDYLTTYRIVQAKKMLLNSDAKIYEIAEKVGYTSPQYFSQIFKKTTNMSPQEYKTSKGVIS